jgi:hypothetical protein
MLKKPASGGRLLFDLSRLFGFFWLNETNQMNQINQKNKTNEMKARVKGFVHDG